MTPFAVHVEAVDDAGVEDVVEGLSITVEVEAFWFDADEIWLAELDERDLAGDDGTLWLLDDGAAELDDTGVLGMLDAFWLDCEVDRENDMGLPEELVAF